MRDRFNVLWFIVGGKGVIGVPKLLSCVLSLRNMARLMFDVRTSSESSNAVCMRQLLRHECAACSLNTSDGRHPS